MDFDHMARASDRDPVLVALLTEWGKKKGAAAQRLNASGVEVPNRDTHELRIARLKQRRARRRQQSVDAGADEDLEDACSKLAAADFAVTLASEEKKKKKASGGITMTEKEERGWGATDPLLTSTESKSGNPKDTSYLRFGIRYHTPKDAPLRLNFRAQEDLSRERRNAHKKRADRLQQIIREQEEQEEQDELREMQVAAAAKQDAATAGVAGESKGAGEVAGAAGAAGVAGAASAAGKPTMAGVAGVLIARARLAGAPPLRGRAKRRARKQQFLPPSRYKAPLHSTTHAYSPLFNKDEFRLRRRDKKIRDNAKYHDQYGHAALIIQSVYR